MCLSNVKPADPEKIPQFGYKAFAVTNGAIQSPIYWRSYTTYTPGKWYTAPRKRGYDPKKNPGFHVFCSKKAALRYACNYQVVYKVEIQEPIYNGVQKFLDDSCVYKSLRSFTCRKMRLVEKVS